MKGQWSYEKQKFYKMRNPQQLRVGASGWMLQGKKADTFPTMYKHDHPTHLGFLGSLDKASESKAGEQNTR